MSKVVQLVDGGSIIASCGDEDELYDVGDAACSVTSSIPSVTSGVTF